MLADARAAARNKPALGLAVLGAFAATALALRLAASAIATATVAVETTAIILIVAWLVHRLGQFGRFGLEKAEPPAARVKL